MLKLTRNIIIFIGILIGGISCNTRDNIVYYGHDRVIVQLDSITYCLVPAQGGGKPTVFTINSINNHIIENNEEKSTSNLSQ